jgi:hypothetical protein
MSKHIWLAIPAYTGQIHLATMRSIMTDWKALRERGDSLELYDEAGNPYIADARAQIVSCFLASKADTLVFVDSDVSWEAGALLRLIDAPEDVVAGIYPFRADPIAYPIDWLPEKAIPYNQKTGLIQVRGVPAGFLKITRSCLEKMVEAYKDLEFHCEKAPEKTAWALFAGYRVNGGRDKLGEDYAFCARWRDIGGTVWAMPEVKMGHCGFKTFYGSLGEWLRNRAT